MTRPQIIRADTIDLQDRLSPSAQDHTRQPTHPAALGAGPPAPHQAETLREVAAEAEEEQRRSPRASTEWPNSDLNYTQQHYGNGVSSAGASDSLTSKHLQQQDALAVAQNGGLAGAEDADMADAEGDDGLEDDMMDKISSSPSIDDGGYSLPNEWPARLDPPTITPRKSSMPFQVVDGSSSSPFVGTPNNYPLHYLSQKLDKEPNEPGPRYLPCSTGLTSKSDLFATTSYIYDYEGRDTLGPLASVESYDNDFDPFSTDDMFAVQADADLHSIIEDRYEGVLTFPCESSREEEIPYPEDSRFVDSGWGGECLRDSEDIDFDFVYALHTFVANVEGQANATKGDTMVLLDDSNSYWWLVRVVKDSSIGYLPAEHIETPTERLARLNKHRNIDLSATMLGDKDLGEKTKNPLKKAIRRRGAKTVTFSAPTYVEASDIDYSTDEGDGEGDYYVQEQQQQQQSVSQQAEAGEEEITVSESVAAKSEVKEADSRAISNSDRSNGELASKASSEVNRNGDEMFGAKSEGIGKSRNGTVRNTDSFFKDDSVETRKITLTPNLLRDDSSTSTGTSNDSKEIRQRASLDRSEKDAPSDKGKDDRKKRKDKEKDKKPGMLSGLFKRGNKKSKLQEEDIDEIIFGKKSSEEARASPAPSKDSDDFAVEDQPQSSPQRQLSKLQKQPRSEVSVSSQVLEAKSTDSQQPPAPERPPPSISAVEPSLRLVQSESQQTMAATPKNHEVSLERMRDSVSQQEQDDQKSSGALSKILWKGSSGSEPRPEKVKKAKVRSELDDFDSADDRSPAEETSKESISQASQLALVPDTYSNSYISALTNETTNTMNERLSESPVQISPIEASRAHPPALVVDTSSQGEVPSPMSSPSPELVDAGDIQGKKGSENSISTLTSVSTWNDAHLRTFFDDNSDIKDLLVVVYDKSGVIPAGPDHPITGNMFKEENAMLMDITNRLDSMLVDWLARKMRKVEGRA